MKPSQKPILVKIFFIFLISSAWSFGSHLSGGGISWECVGNDSVVFRAVIYANCKAGVASFSPPLVIEGPSGSEYVCQLIAEEEINNTCYANTNPQCYTDEKEGALIRYILKSDTLPLPGTTIPPAGWRFFTIYAARPDNSINGGNEYLFLQSFMYPSPDTTKKCASSAVFLGEPTHLSSTGKHEKISALAYSPNPLDSLYYDFGELYRGQNIPISWAPGFSYEKPFPNPSSHPSNGPVTIDHENGTIEFDVQVAQEGIYPYKVKVEQWKNKTKVNDIEMDFYMYVSNSDPEDPPSADIDTLNYPNLNIHRTEDQYNLDTYVGDTLEFEMNAEDLDMNNDSSIMIPQNIVFDAYGYALDTNWNKYENPPINSFPELIPKSPQTSFQSPAQNDIIFRWFITPDLVKAGKTPYQFRFSFIDDACPYPREKELIVTVNVLTGTNISMDSIVVCEGDSVQLSGMTTSEKYSWSPASGFSDTAVQNPVIFPLSSGYYYLTDPQTPSLKDSIYVEVEPSRVLPLVNNNGLLTLNSSVTLNSVNWYYNGVPLQHPYDTLTAFASGDYWLEAVSEASCLYVSDTQSVMLSNKVASTDPVNGEAEGPGILEGLTGIYFTMNGGAANDLVSVKLPGIITGSGKREETNFNIKIFEVQGETEMFDMDTSISKSGILNIPVGIRIEDDKEYCLALKGDSTTAFYVYHNVNYSFSPQPGITISGAYKSGDTAMPSIPSDDHLIVGLQFSEAVGNDEKIINKDFKIFPNPVDNILSLEWNETSYGIYKGFEVMDMSGRVILSESRSLNISGNILKIDVRTLPEGMYILKLKEIEEVEYFIKKP